MNLLLNSGILEVGIPKDYYKFNSEKYLQNHVNNELYKFFQKLKKIDDIDIYDVEFDFNLKCPINDFNYSYYNEFEKSKTHDVYRCFKLNTIALTRKEGMILLGGEYQFPIKTKYGELLINIILSLERNIPKRKKGIEIQKKV